MRKLFRTFCVLLAITSSSQASAASAKPSRNIDANKLLPFSQPNRRTSYPKNLEGLYSIKEFQATNIIQPHREFNLLYQKAMTGQKELESICERIALQSNTYCFSSGVKSKRRAIDKINTKLAGNSEQIMDLARNSIVAKNVPALMNAFELIEQETQLLRVKNRFKTPGASGYRDLSLLIRLPKTQIIAEVQLHLEAFSVIKNGKEHDNYQRIQQIQRARTSENRVLNDLELASIKKLRTESRKMYQQAWNSYLCA